MSNLDLDAMARAAVARLVHETNRRAGQRLRRLRERWNAEHSGLTVQPRPQPGSARAASSSRPSAPDTAKPPEISERPTQAGLPPTSPAEPAEPAESAEASQEQLSLFEQSSGWLAEWHAQPSEASRA
jgi:hypothetical protein